MKSERSSVSGSSHASRFSRERLYLNFPTLSLNAGEKLKRTTASSSWKSVPRLVSATPSVSTFRSSVNSVWT